MHVYGTADAGAGDLTLNPDALHVVYKQMNAHTCFVVLLCKKHWHGREEIVE